MERIHTDLQLGHDPREVFNKYEIDRYRITPRTFCEYARYYLREWAARMETPVEARKASATDVVQSALDSILTSLDIGRDVDKGAIFAVKAGVDVLKLDIDREVNRRADEKHDVWKAEQQRKQAAALEAVSSAAQLTPAQVAEIRLKVLGL